MKKKHYIRNAIIAVLISFLLVILSFTLPLFLHEMTNDTHANYVAVAFLIFLMTSLGAIIYAIVGTIHEGIRVRAAAKALSQEQTTNTQPAPTQSNFDGHGTFYTSIREANPLDNIDYMDGLDFEHWCADLLLKNGFQKAEVTRGSGDQGVDIIAEKDDIRYAIQCKRYSSNLGNTPVQEVSAGKTFYNCQIGLVMTNRYFTQSAIELAKSTGTILWDRDKLMSMSKQNEPENATSLSEQFEYYCEYLLKRNYHFTRIKAPIKTSDRTCDLVGYRRDGTAWVIFCVQDGACLAFEHINKLTSAKSEYHAQCMAIMTSTCVPGSISAYAKEKNVVLFENLTGNIDAD